MTGRLPRVGIVAVALAVIGSAIAVTNDFIQYQRTGILNWSHVALAFAVPVLIFVMIRASDENRRE